MVHHIYIAKVKNCNLCDETKKESAQKYESKYIELTKQKLSYSNHRIFLLNLQI